MIVVSNTTPILSLYKIGQLSLLQGLFGEVTIPTAVYNEIAIYGKNKAGYDIFDSTSYIHIKEVKSLIAVDLLRPQLGYGETEAIVLAKELEVDVLLIDEKKARRIAQVNAIPVIGTLGILLLSKFNGLILEIKTLLDALIDNGIWIDKQLYQSLLKQAGE